MSLVLYYAPMKELAGFYEASGIRYPETDLFGYPDSLIRSRTSFAYTLGCGMLLNVQHDSIIDIGSGHGHGIGTINEILKPSILLSTDRWEQFLVAQKRAFSQLKICGNAEFVTLNAPDIPFKQSYFDAIFCMHVIEHLQNPEAVLQNLVNTTKPGGYIIIATPNINNLVGINPHDERVYSFDEIAGLFRSLSLNAQIFSAVPNDRAWSVHIRKQRLASYPFTRYLRRSLAKFIPANTVSKAALGDSLTLEDFSTVSGDHPRSIDFVGIAQVPLSS